MNNFIVLAEHISGLPAVDADGEFARRFDLLILNLQLALLQNNSAQASDQLKMREIAKGLEEKSAIPGVAAQLDLVQALQTGIWWENVTPADAGRSAHEAAGIDPVCRS